MTIQTKKVRLDNLPQKPGVYFFIDRKRQLLYIGKAANLRARLRSYFTGTRSEKTLRLLRESKMIKVEPLESEIAAILEEARWIKRVRPKYNILLRDDKNYFFVGITNPPAGGFPRIFVTHQPKAQRETDYIGPFVNGRTLRKVLQMIRHYFPYCTCKKPHARICLSAQLGNCPGYCCRQEVGPSGKVQPPKIKHYQETIAHIRRILQGKTAPLKNELKRKIEVASRAQEFELAADYRRQYEGLEEITKHRGFIEAFAVPGYQEKEENALSELAALIDLAEPPEKIEMYDVSMISGTNAVGAMTVFVDGKADKTQWRLFKIRRAAPTNDPQMLAEVITRRLSHPEWKFPDLILVDGGISQLNASRKEAKSVPVAAISKGEKRKNDRLLYGRPPKSKSFKALPPSLAKFLTKIRNETHRYAISYHRKRRKMQLLS